MNPSNNPKSREKQEHEDSGHAVNSCWCAACVEDRGVDEQHRIELLDEEESERTTPTVAFDCGFMTQENADTLPILICRDSRYGQTGATCCDRKSPTAHSISFLVVFYQRLWFSQNYEEMRRRTEDEIVSRRADPSLCWSGSGSAGPTRGDQMAYGRVMAVREGAQLLCPHQRGAHADQLWQQLAFPATTPPKSPPQRTPKDFNIQEHPSAANIPMQAEFPQC